MTKPCACQQGASVMGVHAGAYGCGRYKISNPSDPLGILSRSGGGVRGPAPSYAAPIATRLPRETAHRPSQQQPLPSQQQPRGRKVRGQPPKAAPMAVVLPGVNATGTQLKAELSGAVPAHDSSDRVSCGWR
jgi:hypothetical protein